MSLDYKRFQRVMRDLIEMKGDSLRLPMPRRSELEAVTEFREITFGRHWPLMCGLARQEVSTQELLPQIDAVPELVKLCKDMGLETASLTTTLIILRHQMLKAPIMTVSEGLSQMLEDTNISDEVPAKFFSAPFKTTYIEFDSAEQRHNARFSVTASGIKSLCEGCYVQERLFDILPRISLQAIDGLGLDSKKPVRVIELGFSASPFNNPRITSIESKVSFDSIDFAGIYIQDENEPIKEVLERHFIYYRSQYQSNPHLKLETVQEFEKLFSENFSFLTKVLFYLHIDRKDQRSIKTASELEERINKVAEKKRDKLKKQLNRVYDHIVIGPQTYTPLSERLDVGEMPKGMKSPHYRRGTIGIRWVGTGAAKEAVLVRIKESLVNKHLLDQDSVARKNYIIK